MSKSTTIDIDLIKIYFDRMQNYVTELENYVNCLFLEESITESTHKHLMQLLCYLGPLNDYHSLKHHTIAESPRFISNVIFNAFMELLNEYKRPIENDEDLPF